MDKHQFNLVVFVGVLLGAFVGTFLVPGLGTLVGAITGGVVGFFASRKHRARVAHHELPPRM